MMDDLFYPDNPKRERRLNELTDDINYFMHNLSESAYTIKSVLSELDPTVRQMYVKLQVEIPSDAIKKYDYYGWSVEAITGLQTLIDPASESGDLAIAGVSALLMQGPGHVDKSILEDVIGLPSWFSFGSGGAVVLALELLGVFGEKRAQLRAGIHGSIQPRIRMKKASIVNLKLAAKLKAVKTSIAELKKLSYTKEQLDDTQKKVSEDFKDELSTISDETVKEELAQMDRNRGSWTDEDH